MSSDLTTHPSGRPSGPEGPLVLATPPPVRAPVPTPEPAPGPAASRPAVPRARSSIPPRQVVHDFAPIRCGASRRYRLWQAVRHRPGLLAGGLLAAATALAVGPAPPGTPPPTAPASARADVAATGSPRCATGP
ncbi:hypothetical protein ACIGXM_08360 [Kitasatospora sp. NPDC052896]|uniref:hypothetical protein n=1 Tax=Kitasatospora sp. NPDC052896 TaxID=3364061 RepID=UPI0037CB1B2D